MSEYINQSSCQQTKKAERSEEVQRWNDQNFGGEGSHVGPRERWAKEELLESNHPWASAATLPEQAGQHLPTSRVYFKEI